MSRFNSYARELDKIAIEAFTTFKKADDRLNEATKVVNKYNRFGGKIPQELVTEHARAKADYLEAKDSYKVAQKGLSISGNDQIRSLRDNLISAIEAENMADPAQLDASTLELLKSGILTANEYAHLLEQAKKSNNFTMVRLIGKYAEDATTRETDPARVADLRAISYNSKSAGYADQVQAFDSLLEIMDRTANNPAMISHWKELTADIVEQF